MLNTIDRAHISERLDGLNRQLYLARLACYGIDEAGAPNCEGSLVAERLFEIEKELSEISAEIHRPLPAG